MLLCNNNNSYSILVPVQKHKVVFNVTLKDPSFYDVEATSTPWSLMYLCSPLWLLWKCAACCFVQKMLRVKDEEMSLQERRDNYHRRRRYSDDYDSEADLYQQYKAAGLDSNMVAEHLTS